MVGKTLIWLDTCSSVLCILTTIKTLLYKIMIQSAACFDPPSSHHQTDIQNMFGSL